MAEGWGSLHQVLKLGNQVLKLGNQVLKLGNQVLKLGNQVLKQSGLLVEEYDAAAPRGSYAERPASIADPDGCSTTRPVTEPGSHVHELKRKCKQISRRS